MNDSLPSHLESSYEGAKPVLVHDCCGDPVPMHRKNCINFRMTVTGGDGGWGQPLDLRIKQSVEKPEQSTET